MSHSEVGDPPPGGEPTQTQQPDDVTELHYLRSERDRLRAEKAEIGGRLVALDAMVNVSSLRRRVLWTTLFVLILSPLIYAALMGLFLLARYRPGM